MELPDVLGWEETEASSMLEELGWKVIRETTQPAKPLSFHACRRVIRLRILPDKEVELVVTPVAEESCPDWIP